MKRKLSKNQGYSQQEEVKARRVIRNLCIGLALLAVFLMIIYSMA